MVERKAIYKYKAAKYKLVWRYLDTLLLLHIICNHIDELCTKFFQRNQRMIPTADIQILKEA